MAAPLGVKSKNEIVSLDISDKGKAHGPHGLVAGTTGSGKSEILQTYVLSMASLYHPYDVGFVIIDFKGGGMANQFTDLPHLMGTITNIDGREINRSLMSIKAELVYRQEVFSRSGVNHINDYIKLYKSGKVEEPMPHLIMIVDEFAELKAEYPDFMKEIISAARIGRTLGVHLILATQKPSGVVDNQIWSNSKFRLCLKVQTKEDSKEVIKTPLAAEIVEPGRAYFQVGNNEIFELFQSAYSGAKVPTGEDNVKNYSIYAVNFWGKREMVFQNKKGGDSDKGETQLQAMVSYIHDYCQEEHIRKVAEYLSAAAGSADHGGPAGKGRRLLPEGRYRAAGVFRRSAAAKAGDVRPQYFGGEYLRHGSCPDRQDHGPADHSLSDDRRICPVGSEHIYRRLRQHGPQGLRGSGPCRWRGSSIRRKREWAISSRCWLRRWPGARSASPIRA